MSDELDVAGVIASIADERLENARRAYDALREAYEAKHSEVLRLRAELAQARRWAAAWKLYARLIRLGLRHFAGKKTADELCRVSRKGRKALFGPLGDRIL